MTREEAKKLIFSQWQSFLEDYIDYGGISEAYKMALKALEEEPCEDCISREAVNTLVDELARAISDERCCMSRGRSTSSIMQDILDLPSVTPKRKMGFDGMTNGEVIKTLFPSCKTRSENTPTNFMEFTLDGVVGHAIEKSWWNAPYKAESEDMD